MPDRCMAKADREAGFNSGSNFYHGLTGVNPSRYRRQYETCSRT
jgi:hypothetical protein